MLLKHLQNVRQMVFKSDLIWNKVWSSLKEVCYIKWHQRNCTYACIVHYIYLDWNEFIEFLVSYIFILKGKSNAIFDWLFSRHFSKQSECSLPFFIWCKVLSNNSKADFQIHVSNFIQSADD